jgi:hypothetical protein
VTLLSDPDFAVAKSFGAYGEKQFMGRKYLGIMRWTYVINREGVVVGMFDQVDPQTHAEQLLQFLRAGAVMPRPKPVEVPPAARSASKPKKPVRRKASVAKAVKKGSSRRPPSRSVKGPKPASAKKRSVKRSAGLGGPSRKGKKR